MAGDPSQVFILLDGVDSTYLGRLDSLRISDELNDAPNSAALTTRAAPSGIVIAGAFLPDAFDSGAFQTAETETAGVAAHVGQRIQIYLGEILPDNLIFGGEIIVFEQLYELVPKNLAFYLSCLDFTRRGNRKQVLRAYGQQSATAIVLDLVARYTDLTAAHVAADLPIVEGGIVFTWEDVSRALSRVAEKIGASWYWDYTGDLHFFLEETADNPDPLTPPARFADLKISTDITQVRTRVLVEGSGSTVLRDVAPGESIIPIRESIAFNAAGGGAIVGTQRIPYAGVVAGDVKVNTVGDQGAAAPAPSPPGAPTAAIAAGTAGALAGGPYRYGVTFELADGSRSNASALSNAVTIAAATPGNTSAVLSNPKRPGPIPVGHGAAYATTFVDAAGRETTRGNASIEITAVAVAAPAAGAIVGGTVPGAMAGGYYFYRTTFLTPSGETTPADNSWGNTGGAGGFRLSVFGTSDTRVVGRRIYRSSVGPDIAAPVLPWRVVADIPGTNATTYDDVTADANLPATQLPVFNTATDVGEAASVTIPTSADPRVTRRRIYRLDDPGTGTAYRLVEEITNNTTTNYLDNRTGGTGQIAPAVNTLNTGAINVTAIGLGPAGTVRRRIFRTTAGGSALRELTTIENNTATTVLDAESDISLGGAPLPAVGGPAPAVPPTPIGSTTVRVSDHSALPDAGWILVGDQMVRYTGKTADAGVFLLTGIPASGAGAITATIPAGDVVTASPALTGATVTAPILADDEIQLLVELNDAAAQTAIAALEGGDGIIEEYIQDRRLSEAGARARGLASLELFKAVEVKITYTTYDEKTRTGRTVHVDLPAPTNLVGDFLIQSVEIDRVSFAKHFMPRRRVVASSTRFTFENVLQRLLMEAY